MSNISYIRFSETETKITGNTYPLKDTLKLLGGKFDMERKTWVVPTTEVSKVRIAQEKYQKEQKQASVKKWEKALENTGYKFVKKGTAEYDIVLEEFKKL